jgi:hypothetical protein
MRALVILMLLLVAAVAHAGPDEDRARADELIKEGVELRKEGRESDAFERFRAAHELFPSARASGQMGLAAKSLRRYVEAEAYLEAALAAADDPWVIENQATLELARQLVANQLASLLVRSNVAGELLVNGAAAATLPLAAPLRVIAGAAVVQLRAPGYVPAETEVTLPAGAVTELRLDLSPVAAAPAPPPSPRPAPIIPPPPPQPEAPAWRPWSYAAAGLVGAAGLGLGIGFGVLTIDKRNERDTICPDPTCTTEEGVDLDDEARTAATLSTVSFVAAGTGLAALLVLLLTEPSDEAQGIRVTPAGLSLTF